MRVPINHLRTRTMRSSSVSPSEMLANSSGCSHQYAGNSVSDVGERMTVEGRMNQVGRREWRQVVECVSLQLRGSHRYKQ